VSDPLVRHLKRVREAHHMTQAQVEECMELPEGTYRHIERGRRSLPDFRDSLVHWVQKFENCVGASTKERRQILEELSRAILEQFAVLLRDIEQGT
jgi:transcriptional regulator with XRE-family HTH domain